MDKEYFNDWLGYYPSGTAVTDAAGSLRNVLIIVKDVEDTLRKNGYHCSAMLGEVRQVVRASKLSKAAVVHAIDAYSKRTIENTGEV